MATLSAANDSAGCCVTTIAKQRSDKAKAPCQSTARLCAEEKIVAISTGQPNEPPGSPLQPRPKSGSPSNTSTRFSKSNASFQFFHTTTFRRRIRYSAGRSRRVLLSDDQRRLLAVKGKALGRQQLAKTATIAQADTILRWHRELIELQLAAPDAWIRASEID